MPLPSRALRVLVAEDNPVNQKLIVKLLERQGHEVVLVGDGRRALDTLAEQRFDVAFLDIQMPELDGLEVARAFRALEAQGGGRLCLYALTAMAMEGDRQRCIDAGMDGYLSKPIQPSVLQKLTVQLSAAA